MTSLIALARGYRGGSYRTLHALQRDCIAIGHCLNWSLGNQMNDLVPPGLEFSQQLRQRLAGRGVEIMHPDNAVTTSVDHYEMVARCQYGARRCRGAGRPDSGRKLRGAEGAAGQCWPLRR
jgi:hypothetical protein